MVAGFKMGPEKRVTFFSNWEEAVPVVAAAALTWSILFIEDMCLELPRGSQKTSDALEAKGDSQRLTQAALEGLWS